MYVVSVGPISVFALDLVQQRGRSQCDRCAGILLHRWTWSCDHFHLFVQIHVNLCQIFTSQRLEEEIDWRRRHCFAFVSTVDWEQQQQITPFFLYNKSRILLSEHREELNPRVASMAIRRGINSSQSFEFGHLICDLSLLSIMLAMTL